MSENQLVKEIVQIASDGADFYVRAQDQLRDSESGRALGKIFARMAAAKLDLIAALSGHLRVTGETPPAHGTILGSLRQAYTTVLAKLSADDAEVYVAQLEQAEDRLLEHMQEALASCSDAEVRQQLEAHLPRIRACHDEMRALKHRMAAV